MSGAITLYKSFKLGGVEYSLDDYVYMRHRGQEDLGIAKLVKVFETEKNEKKVKVIWFFRPVEVARRFPDINTVDKEIFLARAHGKFLSTVAPLESVSGKCNVLCLSKLDKNAQLTQEEFRKANYIFCRTFDMGLSTVSETFPIRISHIPVEHLFKTRKDVQETCVDGIEDDQSTTWKPEWQHGSVLIAGIFEKILFIHTDTRVTTQDGDEPLEIVNHKAKKVRYDIGDDIMMGFIGDNDLFVKACNIVQSSIGKAEWKNSTKDLTWLAKKVFHKLKKIELVHKHNQGIDLFLARYEDGKHSAAKIIVNVPSTSKDKIFEEDLIQCEGAVEVTIKELEKFVVFGAEDEKINLMIRKRLKTIQASVGDRKSKIKLIEEMLNHGVLLASIDHNTTGSYIYGWKKGWKDDDPRLCLYTDFKSVLECYFKEHKSLKDEGKAILVVMITKNDKFKIEHLISEFKIKAHGQFLGERHGKSVFRVLFEDENVAEFVAKEIVKRKDTVQPILHGMETSQIGKITCVAGLAMRKGFVSDLKQCFKL